MSEHRARQVILAGAILAAAGVGALGAWGSLAAGLLLLLGWITLVYGVHAFGRAGGA